MLKRKMSVVYILFFILFFYVFIFHNSLEEFPRFQELTIQRLDMHHVSYGENTVFERKLADFIYISIVSFGFINFCTVALEKNLIKKLKLFKSSRTFYICILIFILMQIAKLYMNFIPTIGYGLIGLLFINSKSANENSE